MLGEIDRTGSAEALAAKKETESPSRMQQLAVSTSSAASALFAPRRTAAARRQQQRLRLNPRAHAEGPAGEEEGGGDDSARAFRRSLSQSGNYSRKLMKDEDAARLMEEQGIGAVSKGVQVASKIYIIDGCPGRA